MPSDYVPKRYHDQQVTALTDRCVLAEAAIVDLLCLIDEDILKRNHFDWLAAVRELMS